MTNASVHRGRRAVRRTAHDPEALRTQAKALRSDFPRPVPELLRLEFQRYADALEAARVLEEKATELELRLAARRGRR